MRINILKGNGHGLCDECEAKAYIAIRPQTPKISPDGAPDLQFCKYHAGMMITRVRNVMDAADRGRTKNPPPKTQ